MGRRPEDQLVNQATTVKASLHLKRCTSEAYKVLSNDDNTDSESRICLADGTSKSVICVTTAADLFCCHHVAPKLSAIHDKLGREKI